MCGCKPHYKGLRPGTAVYTGSDGEINVDGYFSYEIENVGESEVAYDTHKPLSQGDTFSNCNQGGLPFCGKIPISWPENDLSKKLIVNFTIPIPCESCNNPKR